jgi:hypothetical protein
MQAPARKLSPRIIELGQSLAPRVERRIGGTERFGGFDAMVGPAW